jgi:hypothetical protein
MSVDRYIQQGYLGEDEKGVLYMDWRSRAEVDQKRYDLIVSFGRRRRRGLKSEWRKMRKRKTRLFQQYSTNRLESIVFIQVK